VILILYSALVRSYLENCIQMWSSQNRRDMIQRRATKNDSKDGTALPQGQDESWGCTAWRRREDSGEI